LKDKDLKIIYTLVNLQRLNLHDSKQISSKGWEGITRLTNLRHLDIDGSSFPNLLLETLTRLKQLYITHCIHLTDRELHHIYKLSDLQKLELWGYRGISD